jgi:MFS family permease
MTRRRAPFTALLTAYVISLFGTSMSGIAIPWLVLTTTGSAAKTGLVAFAQMTPYVVAQALSGPIVDRFGLRRCYVWGNAIAAVAMGAIPLMYVTHQLSLGVLLGLVAAAGLVRGGADCANSALVPTTAIVGEIALERAAGLNAGANRSAILLGAPLAGILVTVAGTATVVAIDAVTFAIGAIIVAIGLRGVGETPAPDERPAEEVEPGNAIRRYGRDLAAGFRFLRGDRLLLGIITMVAASNLLDQGFSEVMLPVWVRQELGSASALGILGGVFGLGSLIGNLLGAAWGPRLPRRATYGVGYLLGGVPRFIVLAVAATISPVLVVFLVAEVFGGVLNPIIGAVSYERIPAHLRARVLGVVRASAWIGIPFGALLGGYAVEAFGVRAALIAFGAAYALISLPPFIFPVWRGMRRTDSKAPEPRDDDRHRGLATATTSTGGAS